MESDLNAQKFLNEIKSIFGISGCFYLISVSEDAMCNFERRGLPFRDVFDSSFDNIVYVDYFNLDESISLLTQRVIGKPMPFFYLSYCLSGGLPRDIIRTFRHILEIRRSDINTLESISLVLFSAEIRGKMRATCFVLKKYELLPESEGLIKLLYDIQYGTVSCESLNSSLDRLSIWREMLNSMVIDSEELQTMHFDMIKIFGQTYVYLSLLNTMLESFDDTRDRHFYESAIRVRKIERIALAWQALSVNPNISKAIIESFRNIPTEAV